MRTPFAVDVIFDPSRTRYLDLGDSEERWVFDPQDATNFYRESCLLHVLHRHPGAVIRRFYTSLTPSTATTPEGLLNWYRSGRPMNYSDYCTRW